MDDITDSMELVCQGLKVLQPLLTFSDLVSIKNYQQQLLPIYLVSKKKTLKTDLHPRKLLQIFHDYRYDYCSKTKKNLKRNILILFVH